MIGQGIDILSLQPLGHILHFFPRDTVYDPTVPRVVIPDEIIDLFFRIIPFQNGVVNIRPVKPTDKGFTLRQFEPIYNILACRLVGSGGKGNSGDFL